MDLGLDGRVALIAGGSSGIGQAIATLLLAEGATVAICGRDQDRLERARAALAEQAQRADGTSTGRRVSASVVDVCDNAAVRSWVERVHADHGALHIVVTNAAGPPAGATDDFSLDDYRAALELSLLSHIGLVQAALPRLREAGWGRVLMVASETVRQPITEYGLSNVVRPGLVGYVKTLVRELGSRDITVNVLAPGITATPPLLDTLPGTDRDKELRAHAEASGIPLGRVASPEEVAAPAVFLLSALAGFVTGTVQVVDGGRTLGV